MDYSAYIPLLEISLSETVSQKAKLQENVHAAISDIQSRVTFLHQALERACTKMKQKVLQIQNSEMKRLQQHETELKHLLERLGGYEHESISDGDESAVGYEEIKDEEAETETRDKNTNRNDSESETILPCIQRLVEFEHICVQFKAKRDLTDDALIDVFGSVDDYKLTMPMSVLKCRRRTFPELFLKQMAEFRCKQESGNIHAIAPISETEAWICCGWGSNSVHLYDAESNEKKVSLKLDIQPDHMVFTRTGDVLISCYNGKSIHRLDEQLKLSKFASISFIPRGMSVTETNEVYVCGVARMVQSTNSETGDMRRHLIAKFSSAGELLSEITISPHDPHRMSVTPENNFCISDYGRNNKRQVVILDMSGNAVSFYKALNANMELEKPFYPLGTICDSYGHIIVADWNNDCVHLLNKDGRFIRFLLAENEIESPSALAIDRNGQLWVGNATGVVKVFQYIR